MLEDSLQLDELGRAMHQLAARLYPIPRSITGSGVRQSLGVLADLLPIQLTETPSGTKAFDWTVPNEWNVREAYIADAAGNRIIDYARCSLHLVNYSIPTRQTMSLAQLRPHLFTLPDRPDAIPYRTSYYSPSWGFCLTQRQLDSLPDGPYTVVIDSTIEPGSLTWGEVIIPGQTADEILFWSHLCHPALANDNLSGIVTLAHLARALLEAPRPRHTIRFVWSPATIGSIAWLARNEHHAAANLRHGVVVSCIGDPAPFTYKKSRRGTALVDQAMQQVLADLNLPHRVREFSPYGYDERQFCSPGFNLPVGLLSRSMHGEFPEYHTSDDNLDFIKPQALAQSLQVLLRLVDLLERNRTYLSTNPRCEPQLGRRGLYGSLGGERNRKEIELAMLWVLNLADGQHSLLDIVHRSGSDFPLIADAAEALLKHGLLSETGEGTVGTAHH